MLPQMDSSELALQSYENYKTNHYGHVIKNVSFQL